MGVGSGYSRRWGPEGKYMTQTELRSIADSLKIEIASFLCHNLIAQVHPNPESDVEYHPSSAAVIARVMCELNGKATRDGINLGLQYMLPKGLKVFGDKGQTATRKELKQLHDRHCFQPMDISKLSSTERQKAMDALMFLTEKRDKTVKGRMVCNGKPSRMATQRRSSKPNCLARSRLFDRYC